MRAGARAVIVGLLAAALWQVLDVSAADARPGGGQSYSSGRSSSSSSGSSTSSSITSSSSTSEGGGSMPAWLGIPLMVVMFVGVPGFLLVVARRSGAFSEDLWASRRRGAPGTGSGAWDVTTTGDWSVDTTPRSALASLTAVDPEFSAVLFEDFAFWLFSHAHQARHDERRLATLGPYLTPKARGELLRRPPVGTPVRAVIVGAMSIRDARVAEGRQRVSLVYEANLFVEGRTADVLENAFVRERWVFERPVGVVTRPWKGARTFGCPSCGSAFERTADNRCASCGEPVDDGRFDWQVQASALTTHEVRPLTLTGSVEEAGTDRPTFRDREVDVRWGRLCADDPALTTTGLRARIDLIHRELQAAWSAQDLSPVRPFLSAGLYAYMAAWVEAYRAQGLRNRVDDPKVTRQVLAKVVRDKHYDAVTVRVFGIGRDYTLDAGGAVVGGSREEQRVYSEYWTLIRGAGVRGAPRADKSCPSCGAPLEVGMEGTCGSCQALVTSGDFDWVLSKIEQDDAYTG